MQLIENPTKSNPACEILYPVIIVYKKTFFFFALIKDICVM